MSENISFAVFLSDSLWNSTFLLRTFLYTVTPKETTYSKLEEVPQIVLPVIPYFLSFLAIELAIATCKGLDVYSIRDLLTSTGAGLLSRLPDLFGVSLEIAAYIWVYENLCIYSLPVESVWTWIGAALGVDFCYYWFHRAAHEINFLWAFHQTHHSSEYMNLATALRQAVIQKYGSFIFYLPLGFVIPPPMAVMHFQLNFIYQFWIHTELIGKLGPLEWVFNTASHHRVHHGRNPYAVDKNYAGFLIIWDRMFGTFEPEREKETVVFGLIHNIKSFDAINVQVNHFGQIFKKLRTVWRSKRYHGWTRLVNLFKVICYGPGWFPSKPTLRLGDPKDLPAVEKEVKRYGAPTSFWLGSYCIVHFLLTTAIFVTAASSSSNDVLGQFRVGVAVFITASMCSLGYIYDQRTFSGHVEAARCLIVTVITTWLMDDRNPQTLDKLQPLQLVYAISFVVWLLAVTNTPSSNKKVHED